MLRQGFYEYGWSVDADWFLTVSLAVQDGMLVVAKLVLEPVGFVVGTDDSTQKGIPRGGISRALLKRIKLGAWPAQVRATLEAARGIVNLDPVVIPPAGLLPRRRARRSTARPDRFYAELAAEYVRLVERGDRRPVSTLATTRQVPRPRLRDWLREARDRGLLSAGFPGRPGGALTDAVRAILAPTPAPRTTTPKGDPRDLRRLSPEVEPRRGQARRVQEHRAPEGRVPGIRRDAGLARRPRLRGRRHRRRRV